MALLYDFESATGAYDWAEIAFIGVAAYTFTAADYCTSEQIRAYDQLVIVEESPWTDELARARKDIYHYRIYFDDIGCYEVLATGFIPRPTGQARTLGRVPGEPS